MCEEKHNLLVDSRRYTGRTTFNSWSVIICLFIHKSSFEACVLVWKNQKVAEWLSKWFFLSKSVTYGLTAHKKKKNLHSRKVNSHHTKRLNVRRWIQTECDIIDLAIPKLSRKLNVTETRRLVVDCKKSCLKSTRSFQGSIEKWIFHRILETKSSDSKSKQF